MSYSHYSREGWYVEMFKEMDEEGVFFFIVQWEMFDSYQQTKIYDLISAAEVFSSLMNVIKNWKQ